MEITHGNKHHEMPKAPCVGRCAETGLGEGPCQRRGPGTEAGGKIRRASPRADCSGRRELLSPRPHALRQEGGRGGWGRRGGQVTNLEAKEGLQENKRVGRTPAKPGFPQKRDTIRFAFLKARCHCWANGVANRTSPDPQGTWLGSSSNVRWGHIFQHRSSASRPAEAGGQDQFGPWGLAFGKRSASPTKCGSAGWARV